MIKLKGMTWDHPRGLAPLLAAAESFREQGVDVHWEARSLQGFEETSIAELAADYDLIAIDHPFMGRAYDQQALLRVDTIVGADFVADLKHASVGPSYDSYVWHDALWAIPVDAAAQVSAVRRDLLDKYGLGAPRSWDQVFELAHRLPTGVKLGMPANPTHMLLALATMCHAVAGGTALSTTVPGADLRPAWWRDDGIDLHVGAQGIAMLRKLMQVAHPLSWSSDPIEFFEHMIRYDDLVYTPIAFGYSNYARASIEGRPLSFSGVPSQDGTVGGGMLGGVGLAVSRHCTETDAAGRFLRFVAQASVQRGLYTDAGGQPSDRSAWTDPHVNHICPGFFDTTLPSLDVSFVRPRVSAYPAFQRDGGILLHGLMKDQNTGDREIMSALNALWQTLQRESH